MNVRACAGLLAGFGLALLGCSDPQKPTPEPKPRPSELARELESRLDAAAADGFSGAVRVSVAGQPLVSAGRGLANRERGTENGEHTAFDMGSILKSFTAVAVLKLEEAGALTLDDRLGELLPDVPSDKTAITVREL